MQAEILAILTGAIAPFAHEASAIAKSARSGPVMIGWLGLEGDAQADLAVHGGPDKAIHHYPADHYGFWRAMIGTRPELEQAGGFGENVSTIGIIEPDVCIGDRYRLGTALVEVSQGRQPCWKQGHRLGDPSIVARMVAYRKAGWYYRVIEQGTVAAGDTIELLDRPFPDWDVERTFGLLIGSDGRDDPAALRTLSTMNVLAAPWRNKAVRLLG